MWKRMIGDMSIEKDKVDLGFQKYPGINIKEF